MKSVSRFTLMKFVWSQGLRISSLPVASESNARTSSKTCQEIQTEEERGIYNGCCCSNITR